MALFTHWMSAMSLHCIHLCCTSLSLPPYPHTTPTPLPPVPTLLQEALVLLGANYAPCMRKDRQLTRELENDKAREAAESGCCIRNDRSGCVQVPSFRNCPVNVSGCLSTCTYVHCSIPFVGTSHNI